MRAGVRLLRETPGVGPRVVRHRYYQIRLRMWLSSSDPVRWNQPWGLIGGARLEDDGATLITQVRMDRVSLVPGLFYGMEGMRVGGTRELRIPPHMAYRDRGVEGTIPPNAVLRVEVAVLGEVDPYAQGDE